MHSTGCLADAHQASCLMVHEHVDSASPGTADSHERRHCSHRAAALTVMSGGTARFDVLRGCSDIESYAVNLRTKYMKELNTHDADPYHVFIAAATLVSPEGSNIFSSETMTSARMCAMSLLLLR